MTCECEFNPMWDEPEDPSFWFLRTCVHCGYKWGGLHCEHDGIQNPCPECGVVPTPVPDDG